MLSRNKTNKLTTAARIFKKLRNSECRPVAQTYPGVFGFRVLSHGFRATRNSKKQPMTLRGACSYPTKQQKQAQQNNGQEQRDIIYIHEQTECWYETKTTLFVD